jgi:hypothetical protein
MPLRQVDFLFGLIGIFAALLIWVTGRNVQQLLHNGPCFLRRLLSAGLALISFLGLGSPATAGAGNERNASEASPHQVLSSLPGWSDIETTWKEGEEIATGKRGAFPFNEAGKKKILAELQNLFPRIDGLVSSGKLGEPVAAVLRLDLQEIIQGVSAKRPTELSVATCYSPSFIDPARTSLKRLEARVLLLRKISNTAQLPRPVLVKVFTQFRADLTFLEQADHLALLKPEEQEQARQVIDLGKELLAGLPATGASAEASGPWAIFEQGLEKAEPLAQSGLSTTQQRREIIATLAQGQQALDVLTQEGELASPERDLLAAESEYVKERIFANPPTDSQVTCYRQLFLSPQKKSFKRLSERLPLIERLIDSQTLNPKALEKILQGVEADLKILESSSEPDPSVTPGDLPARLRSHLRTLRQRNSSPRH